MPIWRTTPVTKQPSITLIRWCVFELEDGDRHFVGYCPENREGRVSSRIAEFDPATMQGVTRSGRVYRLLGPSGYDADAAYVWNCWKAGYKIEGERDVSADVSAE